MALSRRGFLFGLGLLLPAAVPGQEAEAATQQRQHRHSAATPAHSQTPPPSAGRSAHGQGTQGRGTHGQTARGQAAHGRTAHAGTAHGKAAHAKAAQPHSTSAPRTHRTRAAAANRRRKTAPTV